jgi:hypothetical protein
MAKEYAGEPMAPDHPFGGIYAVMDRHGMLPDDWACVRCAKPLNADGNHPAEQYAGTFNGLCYGCTGAGPYVVRTATLDGAREVSWPPHSPSWRRDREKHFAYEGCPVCDGLGIVPGTRSWGTSGGESCKSCYRRFYGHPVRTAASRWLELSMRSCEAVFQRAVDAAAGVPKRCSQKQRKVLREAFIVVPGTDDKSPEFEALRAVYKPGYERIRALIKAHFEARGWNTWQAPDRTEEWARAYCTWRGMDYDQLKAEEESDQHA